MGFKKTSAAHARQIVASFLTGSPCDTSTRLEVARDQPCFSPSMVSLLKLSLLSSTRIGSKIGQRGMIEGGSRPTGLPENDLDGVPTHDRT